MQASAGRPPEEGNPLLLAASKAAIPCISRKGQTRQLAHPAADREVGGDDSGLRANALDDNVLSGLGNLRSGGREGEKKGRSDSDRWRGSK